LHACVVWIGGRGLVEAFFHLAGSVHDACQAVGEHAEQHPDARKQEDRRHGELDRVGDVDDLDSVHGRAF
jgi:hypothetical protein